MGDPNVIGDGPKTQAAPPVPPLPSWIPARNNRLRFTVADLQRVNEELRAENRALVHKMVDQARTIEALEHHLAGLLPGPSDEQLANGTSGVLSYLRDIRQVIDSAADEEAPLPATLVLQAWDESEAGWGVRSDGYSLHLTEADRVAAIDAYWSGMPASVPAEYSRPAGGPILVKVGDGGVPVEIARKVQERTAEQGYRSYDPIPKGWRQ